MRVKKLLKIISDFLMFADFIFLMSHEVVRNLSSLGIFETAFFALFVLHHILNGGFYRSLNRGKYNSVGISDDGLSLGASSSFKGEKA